jgi:hypothetical protein
VISHPGDKFQNAGPSTPHPSDEDLSLGTPVSHLSDEDLSLGTPVPLRSLRMTIAKMRSTRQPANLEPYRIFTLYQKSQCFSG